MTRLCGSPVHSLLSPWLFLNVSNLGSSGVIPRDRNKTMVSLWTLEI